jgi:hypothetical protein
LYSVRIQDIKKLESVQMTPLLYASLATGLWSDHKPIEYLLDAVSIISLSSESIGVRMFQCKFLWFK